MTSILSLVNKHNLILIEDCAQSHGARYKGKFTGTFGDFGAFSFFPTKNLGALGDAGAVTVSTDKYNKKLRCLRNYGSSKKYYNAELGINSRLDEVQAAFLRVKLRHLNKLIAHKRKLAAIYNENLKSDFIKPLVQEDFFDVYHIYNIRHEKRDELRQYLFKNDIQTEIHYPLAPNLQKAMKEFFKGKAYPISEEIHNTTLSLPISYGHEEKDILKVTEILNRF